MKRIQAIPTLYRGWLFRSRTEARWAVFFDVLGIPWEYELDGYQMADRTKYLPDFYLPNQDAFFEVKGRKQIVTKEERHKINQLQKDSERPVIVGYSDMSFEACTHWGPSEYLEEFEKEYEPAAKVDSVLVKCRECGKWYFSSYVGVFDCLCCGAYDGDHYFDVQATGDLRNVELEVLNAITIARSARFEHGEQPVI